MYFSSQNKRTALTLIELIIVIAILGIIAVFAANINVKNLSYKQKLEIQTNQILSEFEEVRNNSLLGKKIAIIDNIPESWIIHINQSGSVSSSYFDGSSWQTYKELSFDPDFRFTRLECFDQSDSISSPPQNNIIDIIMQNESLSLSGCTNNNLTKVEIESTLFGFDNTLKFNSVNGLMHYKR